MFYGHDTAMGFLRLHHSRTSKNWDIKKTYQSMSNPTIECTLWKIMTGTTQIMSHALLLKSYFKQSGPHNEIILVGHWCDMRVKLEMAPWGSTALGVGWTRTSESGVVKEVSSSLCQPRKG
jgi:hypothetical protein